MNKTRCQQCAHLETNSVSKKYTCKNNWFGGVSEIPDYARQYCDENKDFKAKNEQQILKL